MKTVTSTPVSFAKAKKILEAREKQGGPRHEQSISLDHLRRTQMVGEEDAEAAMTALAEAVPVLREHQTVMLVNNLPQDEDDVKILFMKERINLEKEQVEKILDIIKKLKPVKLKKLPPIKRAEPAAETREEKAEKVEPGKK